MNEPTISIQKQKRELNVIRVIGNHVQSSISRKKMWARCPDCQFLIGFSDSEVAELWSYFDQWHKEGYFLFGIFDCPNEKCERPFQLQIFSEDDASIGAVGLYEFEKPGVTLKAKRE